MTPIVDAEFAALCPPLTAEERSGLCDSLLAEGCRDALVVWAETGILLDGHNRLAICEAEGLEYRTVELPFTDRLDARIWVLTNQSARRNLTDDQRAIMAEELATLLSERAMRERAKVAVAAREWRPMNEPILEAAPASKIGKPQGRSRAQAAEAMAVSERKVRQAQTIRRADPALAEQVKRGDLRLADATREVRKREQEARLDDLVAREVTEPSGLYDVIVIDPPWPMEKIERDERPNQVAFDYPTLDEAGLSVLPIPCADDCHVWLWTTHKFLPMAFRLLEAWGLKYVCSFVWHKPGGFQPIGLPQYNCEFALYARKGSPKFLDTKAFPVCFEASRGGHSEKPEAFYEVLRRVTGGRRLDMFNRRLIPGFDGWGKEAA